MNQLSGAPGRRMAHPRQDLLVQANSNKGADWEEADIKSRDTGE